MTCRVKNENCLWVFVSDPVSISGGRRVEGGSLVGNDVDVRESWNGFIDYSSEAKEEE